MGMSLKPQSDRQRKRPQKTTWWLLAVLASQLEIENSWWLELILSQTPRRNVPLRALFA